jgi:hypothetical protein
MLLFGMQWNGIEWNGMEWMGKLKVKINDTVGSNDGSGCIHGSWFMNPSIQHHFPRRKILQLEGNQGNKQTNSLWRVTSPSVCLPVASHQVPSVWASGDAAIFMTDAV